MCVVIPGLVPDIVCLHFHLFHPIHRLLLLCRPGSSVVPHRLVEALPCDCPVLIQYPPYPLVPKGSLQRCRSFKFRVFGQSDSRLRCFPDRPDPSESTFALELHPGDRRSVLAAAQVTMPGRAVSKTVNRSAESVPAVGTVSFPMVELFAYSSIQVLDFPSHSLHVLYRQILEHLHINKFYVFSFVLFQCEPRFSRHNSNCAARRR